MEVRIRLQKTGKSVSKRNNYRIVAIGRAKGRQGRNLEILGHYLPARKPAELLIHKEKLQKWIKNGAQMSDTVRSLVSKAKKSAVEKIQN